MNPERFARLIRPLALAALPLYAACNNSEIAKVPPSETAVVAPIAAPKENIDKPDETFSGATETPTVTPTVVSEQSVNPPRLPSKEEVITMAHAMNMGAVFVNVRWLETVPVSLNFSRLDIGPEKKNGYDEGQIIILNKKIPREDGIARAAFFATSCDGLYSVELSPDGGKTTFIYYVKLNPQTCTLDLDISLGKKGQLA